MKKIFSFCLFIIISTNLFAQEQNWNKDRWQQLLIKNAPANLKMSSQLYQLASLATSDKSEALNRIQHSQLRYDKTTNLINVEIIYRNDENIQKITDEINRDLLIKTGFKVTTTWKNRASAWVNIEDLLPFTQKLGKDYFVSIVLQQKADQEAPALMNSLSYKTGAGPAGTGRRVAIFDYGFSDMTGSIAASTAKTPAYVGMGGTASTIAAVNTAGNEHGTACVETLYDHAPNATYELYANGNTTERGAAVASCIAHGVNVISQSLSEYNLGWFDNTGAACAYAQAAANAGILFFTSCGNRGTTHYEATFKDANSNNIHEFSGTDEKEKITTSLVNGDAATCYLSWNTTTGTDLDISVCRTSNNAVLATSNTRGTGVSAFETISWVNNTGVSVDVYFRVTKFSGPATTFEMFSPISGVYQYQVAAGSNTSPSNSTDPNIVSAGALDYSDYDEPPGTSGLIADYSSQGPTNSGNLAPKLVGPTNTFTRIYGGGFGGTSCSTANLAGAVTAFWSANDYLDARGAIQVCYRTAQLYRDWGATGIDNIYGNGGLYLYTWEPGLRYLYRLPENAAITNATKPFYSLSVAETNAPTNSKIIILNTGNYIETGLYGNGVIGGGKNILYIAPFDTIPGNFGF
ncbi:MAG: hypothetical protein ABI091_11900 [Ferruginibacter sp.]